MKNGILKKIIFIAVIIINLVIINKFDMLGELQLKDQSKMDEVYAVEDQKIMKKVYGKSIEIIIELTCAGILISIIYRSIICKNKKIDINKIEEKFDPDLNKYDIALLTTILKKELIKEKDLIQIIIGMIKDRKIELISVLNEKDEYTYFIEKREDITKLKKYEIDLINLMFEKENRVELLKSIRKLYRDSEVKKIIKEINMGLRKDIKVYEAKIGEVILSLISIIIAIISFCVILFVAVMLSNINHSETNAVEFATSTVLIGMLILVGTYIMFFVGRRIVYAYNKDEDIIMYLAKFIFVIQIIIIIGTSININSVIILMLVFEFATIFMSAIKSIKEYVIVPKEYEKIRKDMYALKKYLEKNTYIEQKQFANVILYEEYLMYAFVFNITLKINNELNILQEELRKVIKEEIKIYNKEVAISSKSLLREYD